MLRLAPEVHLLHRPQDDRPAVRPDQPGVPAGRLRPGADYPLAARLSGAAGAADWRLARRGERARRRAAAGVLQPAGRDARHHHGVSRHRAAGGRRLRQLRGAAADRRARHGVSAPEHGQLLVLRRRRPGDARQLLRARRRRQQRLDLLRPALRHRARLRPDVLAGRDAAPHLLVAPRGDEFHHHHRAAARAGPHLVPAAVLCLGAVHHRLPAAARLPGAAGRRHPAGVGPRRRHQLLPAERPGGRRPAARRRRRRQRPAVAAPLLVPRPPGGLRPRAAGDGHRRRDPDQQHAQAALGLPADGLLDLRPRLPVVRRLGPPHVPDRHGHDDQRLLPGDDDDHLDSRR